MKVGMLFFALFSLKAMAGEFTHVKLDPKFEEFLIGGLQANKPNKPNRASGLVPNKSILDPDAVIFSAKLRTAIYGANPTIKSALLGPIPTDGEDSPLYEEIRRNLEDAHQDIGREHVAQINLLNRQFDLGSQNFSGFSWQKPFGIIQVYADRQVTPNLFGENWLVQDMFVFEVEASTFLEKLADAGLALMSDAEIGAFAGMTFKRVYTYYHYAPSYQDGLQSNFTKLFMPFIFFNQRGVEKMDDQEILKREDQWTTKAGGLITIPLNYGLAFSAGALTELAHQQTTTVQSTFATTPATQRYLLGAKGKKSVTAGATLSFQIDFFKLIKFTLLNYDLNYEYTNASEHHLRFSTPQWEQVKNDAQKSEEMRGILRGTGKVVKLEPYVVRLDESRSTGLESRASALIWGKLKKDKTEQVRVISDGITKVFFKSYTQSVKVVQNIFSRLFSAVVYRILKLPLGTTNAAIYNRQINMEYEASHPQASNPKVARIHNSNQFSFVVIQSYDAARTDRWIDKRIKNDVAWFVGEYTTLPPEIKAKILSEELKGPLRVESNLRVEKAGFDHLLNSNEGIVWSKIAKVCGSKRAADWANPATRAPLLAALQSGADSCVKRIGSKFMGLKNDYLANSLMPSLAKFKDFLTDYYKNADRLTDLSDLFGAQNTFMNGRLQATTSFGISYVTSFSSGQFRGLGVIDNFKRTTGSRMPASITNE